MARISGSPQQSSSEKTDRLLTGSLAKPSVARIYDYILGGTHNYAIDREFAEKQLAVMPDMREAMLANRAFLGRAVRYAVQQGIRQFVDIGSGLPSAGQVHQIADEEAPGECRVVYVDYEPIAHAHAEILLDADADPQRHRAVCADYLEYEDLWDQVLATGVINPDEPACLLVVALLHFMQPDQQPEQAMAYYRDQLARDSLLVLSHGCDELDDESIQSVVSNYKSTTNAAYLRSRAEFSEFFGDFGLVDPGLAWVPEWRPDSGDASIEEFWDGNAARSRLLGGVARKS